jgi:hypothetical protein
VALVRICIDIDGTICQTDGLSYSESAAISEAVDAIRALKGEGHYIILFTARGSGTGVDHSNLTRSQLERWGVPFDELLFGKPYADIYIDDKALTAAAWHSELGKSEHLAEPHGEKISRIYNEAASL